MIAVDCVNDYGDESNGAEAALSRAMRFIIDLLARA